MSTLWFVLFGISTLVSHSGSTINTDLVLQFFRSRHLHVGYIFGCFDKLEEVNFKKFLLRTNVFFFVTNLKYKQKLPKISHGINTGVILDSQCGKYKTILKACEARDLFYHTYHWLVFGSNDTVFDTFKYLNTNVNSDIQVALLGQEKKDKYYNIYEVYNQGYEHGGRLKVNNNGYYSEVDGYKVKTNVDVYLRRRDMSGTRFKGIICLSYPFKGSLSGYLNSKLNKHLDAFSRVSHAILKQSGEFYNFSIEFSKTGSTGFQTSPNGSFDGIVGTFQRKEADFGSAIFDKIDRTPFVDYGPKVFTLKHAFILRIPKQDPSLTLYLLPLSSSVWYISVVFVMITIVSLKFALRMEQKIFRNLLNLHENTWSFLIVSAIGVISQQGVSQVPTLYTGRIITITIIFFSMLLYQLYSAAVVSTLLMMPKSSVTTLEELARSNIKVGLQDAYYVKMFLKETKSPSVRMLYEEKILPDEDRRYLEPVEGMKLVYKGDYAYHVDLATAYPIIEAEYHSNYMCELCEIELLTTKDVHISYQKKSPFKEMMTFYVHRILETGIYKHLLAEWESRKPSCTKEPYKAEAVELKEFYPNLMILGIGMIISIIVLIAEILIGKKVKS